MERINVLLCLSACVLMVCWAQQSHNPCPPGRFGKSKSCECSANGGGSEELERGCRPSNASAGALCSHRGDCICGVCECTKMENPDQIISGQFCECDNFSCDRNKGRLCSEHGECICGKCNCAAGFTGSACECLMDDTPCRSPDNDQICSGNGRCVCGQCVCDINDEGQYFFGKFCKNCPTCPSRCEQFKECVLCYVHHRGAEWSEHGHCTKSCALPHLEALPEIVGGQLKVDDSKKHLCSFRYGETDDCSYVFTYSYSGEYENELYITAQIQKECPKNAMNNSTIISTVPNSDTQEQI